VLFIVLLCDGPDLGVFVSIGEVFICHLRFSFLGGLIIPSAEFLELFPLA
jgi:hypothetical protein